MNIFKNIFRKNKQASPLDPPSCSSESPVEQEHDSGRIAAEPVNSDTTVPQAEPTQSADLLQLRKEVLAAEDAFLQSLLTECRRLFANDQQSNEEVLHFAALVHGTAPRIGGAVGYELARIGSSFGTSGFHGHGSGEVLPSIHLPFSFYSWAGFQEWGGIAFRIHRSCFQSANPHLYFEADAMVYTPIERFGTSPYKNAADAIAEYSHRIGNIQVTTPERGHCRIEFDLLPEKAYLGMLELQGRTLPLPFVPDPVIQIPICGEFFCSFGEVTPNGDVPLHRDDFCMK